MKKLILAGMVALFMMTTASFAQTGIIFTSISAPAAVTSNTIGAAPKAASGSYSSVLGLIATGDASINTISKEAGITKIYYVDEHVTSILSLFVTVKFTVYGE
jgi:hypothetical protein